MILLKYAEHWYHTGSRAICNPPPLDTDDDYVVYTLNHAGFEAWALRTGFTKTTPVDAEGYEEGEGEFVTYRMGVLNLIVTESQDFYANWVLATDIARYLNVTDKAKRIALFKRVLYETEFTA